jgi:hypothetical protein
VLETEPKALRSLDEDELIELHARVRRARTKHATNYRRGAAGQVGKDRSRGAASKKNRRDAARAEVFEDALARVSRRLAVVARAAADELREERLATARGERSAKAAAKAEASKGKSKGKGGGGKAATASGKGKRKPTGKAATKERSPSPKDRPAAKKSRASTTAKGKRRQAKRDAR